MYRSAPATTRESWELSRLHEGVSTKEFAASLPPNATVFDIGAGASPFGCDIAIRRHDDIRWVNVDRRYGLRTPLGRHVTKQLAEKPLLANVHYVRADVTDKKFLPSEHGTADRVYCSAVVPHLGRAATRAVHAMAQLLKPTGHMSVSGFDTHRIRGVEAVRVTADEYGRDPDGSVERVVSAMRLDFGEQLLQGTVNILDYYYMLGTSPIGTSAMPRYSPPSSVE